ncbi:IclR family transcriptional regulator [Paeniglutamicibacter kerguelensis]|uniref:DNA-binding IclR family transcriptional regulator n=1 Tax=Paeniglutamicibacter kerguelensis TaxID=254788 RepID=A0ABS4X9X4_9MICC|nr:DNA-binding IclR family transcriptional regulator [Paeniglutamicibacter kerguelensis]
MAEAATRTVERALQLLGAVCDAGAVSLAGVARETELSASTALRLLRTLENSGFVRKDEDGEYRPGLRLVQLGAQALSHESLIHLAAPALQRLVDATGESAYLSVRGHHGTGNDHAVYLAIAEGTHSVRHASWVGRSVPLAGSSLGVVFAGQTPECGYAVSDRGVEEDVTAIAAPLRQLGAPGAIDHTGPVAAISVVAPSYRMTPEGIARIGGLVAAEARALFGAGAANPSVDQPATTIEQQPALTNHQ